MSDKQQLIVLGGGESGTGAALLAARKGYSVFLSDSAMLGESYRQLLMNEGIPFEEGAHSADRILAADRVIKSPGIPDDAPLIIQLREKGIAVVDELHFALEHTTARVVAITGTNGKTTTSLLTYHLMKEAGLQVGLAGNVGVSLAALLAAGNSYDWLVLEVSSFQLDGMPGFKPTIAILLNITPDHLNRYGGSFEKYIASKMQISQHLGEEDAFIFNAEDSAIRAALLVQTLACEQYPVATSGEDAAAVLEDRLIRIKGTAEDILLPYTDIALQGKHNYLNTACAVLAAMRAGVSEASIRRSLQTFVNAPHRMEHVGDAFNVSWINDSKATNVDSAWYALDAMQKPTVWIVGGIDKGNDYSQLYEVVGRKVRAIVCMGLDNRKLLEAFRGMVPELYDTHDLDTAVRKAAEVAHAGDVVLLSPACASFDLFSNYADRGDQFRKKVAELKNRR